MSEREERLRAELFARFEKMGETEVRLMDANPNSRPVSEDIRYSRVWLEEKEDARRALSEERTLSIARKALCSSYWANAIAVIAAIIAIAAIVFQK